MKALKYLRFRGDYLKKWLWLVGVALFMGAIWIMMLSRSGDQGEAAILEMGDVAAYVNNLPVDQEEMNLIMQLSGPATAGDPLLQKDNGQEMKRLLEIKVAQQIAVKYGILKDSSFSAFLKELDIENKRRADALSNKEVIYGPKQYSRLMYYDYRQSIILNSLKLICSEQELDMDEQKLVDYYEQFRERLAKKHDTITIYKIIQPKKEGGEDREEISQIERELKAGQAFMSLYEQWEGDKGQTEIETINEGNYKEISKYRSGYYHLVNGLSPGETSDVLEDEKSYFIMMILEKVPGGYKDLADIREEVIRQYTDDNFESFLRQQMAISEVRLQQ